MHEPAALEPSPPPTATERLEALWEQGRPPDVWEFLREAGDLKPTELAEVLAVDLERRWEGKRVTAEQYLAHPGAERLGEVGAVDLIYGEFRLRELLEGQTPSCREYLKRFRQYARALKRQFKLHKYLTVEDPEMPVPETIGKYKVFATIAEGGQAAVYEAFHPTLKIHVAIKWSKVAAPPDSGRRQRLLDEGRILVGLHHPYLARVYDLDFHEDRPFVVLEYVRGQNLKQWARDRAVSPRQAALLVAQSAAAVGAANRAGVIHQDLKPENIVVTPDGTPRVIDFGLARRQDAWVGEEERLSSGGTPEYMAPEQAGGHGGQVSARTDVFGLGALLYFLLTKRPLYAGNLAQCLEQARQGSWDRNLLKTNGVPWVLRSICSRAMAAVPTDRYATAEALAAALRRWLWLPRALLLLAGAAVLVVLGFWLLSGQTPVLPRPGVQHLVATIEWKDDKDKDRLLTTKTPQELADRAPLHVGDALTFQCRVPRDFQSMAFLLDTAGQLEPLETVLRGNADGALQQISFPTDKTWPLQKGEGTVLVLVCARRQRRPALTEVQAVFEEAGIQAGALPKLPPMAVLLHPEAVEPVDARMVSRDPMDTNFTRVRTLLERLRAKLAGRFDYFVGVAVPRENQPRTDRANPGKLAK
jgi:serine/threonine protein kinase